MTKKIIEKSIAPDHSYVRVGQVAQARTEDEMVYVFRRRAWEDTWVFSHRARWGDDGFYVQDKGYQLPDSVEEWADENLGEWEHFDGIPEYETEVHDGHVRVIGVSKSEDDS